jgi:hypothetical protein
MNTSHQNYERMAPRVLPTRRRKRETRALHFTARITIAGHVIVVHTDAPSRAIAIRQLHWLKKHASIALLEEHG